MTAEPFPFPVICGARETRTDAHLRVRTAARPPRPGARLGAAHTHRTGAAMTPYYEDDLVTLYHGDCREVTEWLTADTLATDPPYGRAWKQGDVNNARGWASSARNSIANDASTAARDEALGLWLDRHSRPGIIFGDLMLPPPRGTKHVLIYDKGPTAGFHGSVGGYRRNVEAVYLVGNHFAGLGGRSAVVQTRVGHIGSHAKAVGHPHAKPVDVMSHLLECTPGVVADPFAGSGSTLVAAKHLGRPAIGIEIDEAYCELAARRLAQDTLFGASA